MAAFIYYNGKQKPEITISTDTQMEVMRMCKYYGLRFQVQYSGKNLSSHPAEVQALVINMFYFSAT